MPGKIPNVNFSQEYRVKRVESDEKETHKQPRRPGASFTAFTFKFEVELVRPTYTSWL
jgi:hypothetical protein